MGDNRMLAVGAQHSVTFYLFDFNDVSVKYCINCVAVVNSAFSGFSGLIMLLFTGKLNSLFNISNTYVFPVIGANLVLFAIFVWYVSARQLYNKHLVSLIVMLDALWVAGSAAIIIFTLFELSAAGNIILGAVAIWIGFLTYKQYSNN